MLLMTFLVLLENSDNYIFYDNIIDMILALDSMPEYGNKIRKASLKAAQNKEEIK